MNEVEIGKVACVGAGLVGCGWATLFSSKGLEVVLEDVSQDVLEKAIVRIKSNLDFLEEKKLLERDGAEAAFKNIETTVRLVEAVAQADYVQENVPDNYTVKKKVFKEMDAATSRETILASSSSGLLMTEIQKATARPERCLLVHPMLPPHLLPLVEVVGGKKTARETIRTTRNFMTRMGKVPVVLKREVPGCIVNRLTAALWRETVNLVANGVASGEDVDRAFCMGIGLRDPVLGPCLRAHIAGGGIERFIEKYSRSYSSRWETMEAWTSLPNTAAEKVIESVNEMKIVRTKTLGEVERLRDEKLVEILRLMQPKHPFY
jgi:3-hydroxypropionate dehydrogenase (NADP+)